MTRKTKIITILLFVIISLFIAYDVKYILDGSFSKDIEKVCSVSQDDKESFEDRLKTNGYAISSDLSKTLDMLENSAEKVLVKYDNEMDGLANNNIDEVKTINKKLKFIDKYLTWEVIKNLQYKYDISIFNVKSFKLPLRNTRTISRLALYVAERMKYEQSSFDCSHLFSLSLKLAVIVEQNNPGSLYYSLANALRNISLSFYYFVEKDMCSNSEMNAMIMTLSEANKFRIDLKTVINKDFEFNVDLINYLQKNYPIKMLIINLVGGNTKKVFNKAKELNISGEFQKAEEYITNTWNLLLYMYGVSYKSLFFSVAETQAGISIMQAVLEDKLGKEVTALDPSDKNKIRYTEENGKRKFYCLGKSGIDNKGKGDSFIYPGALHTKQGHEERMKKLQQIIVK